MFQLSQFGTKFTQKTGILELMDDMGKGLSSKNSDTIMMGGGNPAHIPEIDALWSDRFTDIALDEAGIAKTLGDYTTPQGEIECIEAFARFYKTEFGWNVTGKNIAILPSGQTTFFFLFNLFAGVGADAKCRKILLPLVPEYIGYESQGLCPDMFVANTPLVKMTGDHDFKYEIDFDSLTIDETIAAMCVSRPTNPTGNVVGDDEISRLLALAKKHNIPLILDSAYGMPFPEIVFTRAHPPDWDDNLIFVNSMSKLGLPSVRTAVVVAHEQVISALTAVNAIVSLSTSTLGQKMILPLIQTGRLRKLSKQTIQPYYQKKVAHALAYAKQVFDPSLPYFFHVNEGSIFLWLWIRNLPITSHELYKRLKARGVVVVPGNYFFPGLHDRQFAHTDSCLRLSYAQDNSVIEKGFDIIADELHTIMSS